MGIMRTTIHNTHVGCEMAEYCTCMVDGQLVVVLVLVVQHIVIEMVLNYHHSGVLVDV